MGFLLIMGSLVRVQVGEQKVALAAFFYMHYLYILFSISLDRYYVGISIDPKKRLEQHLNYTDSHFTAKAKDWEIKAVFEISLSFAQARETETFIKKQKSRKLIQQLIDPAFIPSGKLAVLKRVQL